MNKLSLRLAQLMKKAQISESELARRAGVSQPVINRLLSSQNENPKLATLLPIANYFSISLSQLIGEDPLPPDYLPTEEMATSKSPVSVPLLKWEEVTAWPDNKSARPPIDTRATNADISAEGYALQITDAAMRPDFREGTIIVVDPVLAAADQDVVVIQLAGQKLPVCRQILFDLGKAYIKPFNPDLDVVMLDKKYNILGVVVEAIIRVRQQQYKNYTKMALLEAYSEE